MAIKKSQFVVEGAIVIASSLCQILIGGISVVILYGVTKMEGSIVGDFIEMITYIMAMNSGVLLISLWIKEEQVWFGMIPVLSIACVIFCPIVIDLSSMNSLLRYVSYLFPTYYYLVGKEWMLIGILGMSTVGYFIHSISTKMYQEF